MRLPRTRILLVLCHISFRRLNLFAMSSVSVAMVFVGVLGACLAMGGTAHAQGAIRGQYGDWQVRCDTPPGAKSEQCALIQNVTAEDRPNVGLSVIVLRTADKKQRILRVLAPLGVLLPSGLGLKIDSADVGRTAFVRCLPNGCIAEVVIEDKLLEQLKTGKNATFILFQTPEEGIGIPIALAGFGDGFDKLP
jgi:invasion protein IalB